MAPPLLNVGLTTTVAPLICFEILVLALIPPPAMVIPVYSNPVGVPVTVSTPYPLLAPVPTAILPVNVIVYTVLANPPAVPVNTMLAPFTRPAVLLTVTKFVFLVVAVIEP